MHTLHILCYFLCLTIYEGVSYYPTTLHVGKDVLTCYTYLTQDIFNPKKLLKLTAPKLLNFFHNSIDDSYYHFYVLDGLKFHISKYIFARMLHSHYKLFLS